MKKVRTKFTAAFFVVVFCCLLVITIVWAAAETLRPDANGTYQDWPTLQGTTRYGAVSDESDSTYIETDTKDDQDTYDINDSAIGATATINSVEIFVRAKASGSGGAEKIKILDYLNTTLRSSSQISVSRTSFTDYSTGNLTTDPEGNAWTLTNIDALEIGVEVSALGKNETMQVSEMWAEVDYTISGGARPAASAVSIDSGAASVNLTENTTTTVSCTATVSDTDGYASITSVKAQLYRTGVGSAAADDNNNHYTLEGDSECVPSSGSGNTEYYTCDFEVYYYADPTDAGAYSAQQWECLVIPEDAGGQGTPDSDGIEMNSLAALNVTSAINYGTLDLGEDTNLVRQNATITNTGNVNIDVEFSGTNMSCDSGFVPVGGQKYSTKDEKYSLMDYVLSASPVEQDIDLAAQTDDAVVSTDEIYWGLAAPATGAGGYCTGTNTISAVNDIGVD
ncbi:hypothetical protein KJ611_04310 [Patescibacteria group bacterium]|nr:hypothetical protein [Patescibacteria group bacterium]MBU1705551.1 hypothetical protein [Patescibacteria group bacterium]